MEEVNTNVNANSDINVNANAAVAQASNVTVDKISKIPVNLTIEVGQTVMTLQDIVALKEGDVIALHQLSSDPFSIKVNGQKIGEGEIVQNDNQFYVKVSKILDKEDK